MEMAGWSCAGHAEIEPHARAVLRHHWPTVPLHGDVSKLHGSIFAGITMLTGGSPCQDLSIAGKRAGMTEGSGTRSSLFYEQVRIWQESEAPYILWENVLGALSSNTGRDFAAVLSALVGATVPVPDDGWGGAGVASGPTGVAAWRVLDAQYFGVPQRRRRVFVLGARAGGFDPAEVLALSESMQGDSGAGGGTKENSATGTGSPAAECGVSTYSIDTRNASRTTAKDEQNRQGLGIGERNGVAPTLTGLFVPAVATVYEWHGLDGRARSVERASTLSTECRIGREGHLVASPTRGPRLFTPREQERLMGWEDDRTAEGLDEAEQSYRLTDAQRAKLCGNGIASPVAAWIGMRLRDALITP